MEKKHVIIVSGGSTDSQLGMTCIRDSAQSFCIAADSGMNFFYRNGLVPDMIVGDFDSADGEALQYFRTISKIQWEKLNPVKDDTDTEFAIRKAIELGAERITLLGATGSRLDHVLGNIELLGIGLEAGVPMEMLDAKNRIRMIDTGIRLRRETQYGDYVSLLPYTKEVRGLTLTGFKYPLHQATLKGFCSLGISNEILEEEAEISFEEGILLVIESRD